MTEKHVFAGARLCRQCQVPAWAVDGGLVSDECSGHRDDWWLPGKHDTSEWLAKSVVQEIHNNDPAKRFA